MCKKINQEQIHHNIIIKRDCKIHKTRKSMNCTIKILGKSQFHKENSDCFNR